MGGLVTIPNQQGSAPSKEEKRQALDRILKSQVFSRSESLCRFLRFVGEQSIEGNLDQLKEYTIATEALGRSKEYDPSCDSVVRVQANRVRRKLQEYYETEGIDDVVVMDLPGGHYHLAFSSRWSPKLRAKYVAAWARQNAVSLSLGVGCVLFFALWLFSLNSVTELKKAAPNPALGALWGPFLEGTNVPWVVYSNALFLMTDSGDLLRFSDDARHRVAFGTRVSDLGAFQRVGEMPLSVQPLYFADIYTGVGEVVGAGLVGTVFARFNKPVSVKRSRFVDFQDLKNRHVIFLGAHSENALLRKLPRTGELIFERADPSRYEGQMTIRDRAASESKPAVYSFERDPATGAVKSEYALISVLDGFAPNRYMMVLAGLSTLGTQAAAEYVTSPASVSELLGQFAVKKGEKLPPSFQVLLKVDIADGTPIRTHYVTHRVLKRAPLIPSTVQAAVEK